MAPLNLLSFPEELLERILSYYVVAHTLQPPRPSWHRSSTSSSPPAAVRGRLALLLVSKTFLRISTPLFYHTVHITSPNQLHCLLRDALRPSTSLAGYIRRLVLSGIWAEGGELLQLCRTRLETLDITLDTMQLSPGVHGEARDLDAEEFCGGLKEAAALKHIAIRKPANTYLTQPRPRYVLSEIANAMHTWNEIEYVDLAFRVSDDSGARASPGPMAELTRALGTRPRLHTLATVLPTVWNECMLRVSANPALERIILGDGMGAGAAPTRGATWSGRDLYAAPVSAAPALLDGGGAPGSGIPSTGLFFVQAKKHGRLCELIRAGTSIMRTRAQTMGMHTPAPPRLAALHASPPAQAPQACARAPTSASAFYARSQSVAPPAPAPAPAHSSAAHRASASSSSSKRRLPYAGGHPWETTAPAEASPSSSSCSRHMNRPPIPAGFAAHPTASSR